MTRPRKELVSVEDTPYYHIVSRCVRRAFLCGTDNTTGKSYEHRRKWIEDRIRMLSSVFSVDICAYAVMSNHLHIVVKLNPSEIDALSNEQIAKRWTCLFKGPLLLQKWCSGSTLQRAELQAVSEIIGVYRERLTSLSWFMKCLNEPIARQANKEDNCTGHFWEARYKSQALFSEEALLSCMAYGDLNPIRADVATTPEHSEFTSIKERINPAFTLTEAVKAQIELEAIVKFDLPIKPLLNFEGNASYDDQTGIKFSLTDYLELVDFTGRSIRKSKRGAIPEQLPPILQRLNLDNKTWFENATQFNKNYRTRFSRRSDLNSKIA